MKGPPQPSNFLSHHQKKKSVGELQKGEALLALADDPGAREFPWCEQTGNEPLKVEEEGPAI